MPVATGSLPKNAGGQSGCRTGRTRGLSPGSQQYFFVLQFEQQAAPCSNDPVRVRVIQLIRDLIQQFQTSGLPVIFQQINQSPADQVELDEFNGSAAVAVHEDMAWFIRRFSGLKFRFDQVHGEPVAERPGQRRKYWNALQDVTPGVYIAVFEVTLVQRQRQFNPLIMCKL